MLIFTKEMSAMEISQNSPDHFYWYNKMRSLFGPNSAYESLLSFWKDSFLFAIPMFRNKLGKNEYGMDTSYKERNLQFGEAGTIDVSMIR